MFRYRYKTSRGGALTACNARKHEHHPAQPAFPSTVGCSCVNDDCICLNRGRRRRHGLNDDCFPHFGGGCLSGPSGRARLISTHIAKCVLFLWEPGIVRGPSIIHNREEIALQTHNREEIALCQSRSGSTITTISECR